jgi:methionine-rich copper-binding protein CopC
VTRLASLLLSLAASSLATAAIGHPLPTAASPAPNAVLAASPSEIRITFSEGLVARFSGLMLKDAAGHDLGLGPSALDPNDRNRLVAPVTSRLGPGSYTVNWRAVGDDTHHVSGHYSFQVR